MPPPYARGHVRLPNKDHLIEVKYARHKMALAALAALEPATDPEWDSRAHNLVPPVKDQSQCGSCWDFSGTGTVEVAFIVAGLFPPDGSKALSEQYTLDCGRNGGCNGDDNVTVLDWAKKTGLPFTSDYGQYQAQSGRCKSGATALNKIDDWGFADGSGGNGITPVQDIKNAIKLFGCVGCAVAAGSSWDGYQPGTVHHGNSRSIDHDVILVGWKDDKSLQEGGYWIMRNSWGTGWGDKGYMMIAYGADSIGTESVWAVVKNPNPPAPSVLDLFI